MEITKGNGRALAAQICGLGLVAVFALWLLFTVLWQPLTAYEDLKTVEGTYASLERREADSYRLYVTDTSGYTQWYTIDSFVTFASSDLTAVAKPGDPVSLRCTSDEFHTVAELTVGDAAVLTYAGVAEDYRINNLWGLGTALFLLAAAAGLGVFLYIRQRNKRKRQKEIQATLEQLEQERSQRRRRRPEPYHKEERRAVEAYINEAFGPIVQMFFDLETEDLPVDIAVVAPSEEADYYKLVTVGLGAWRMDVPTELAERNCAFAELCMFLPPDWHLLGSDPDNTWPFHWLKTAARLPRAGSSWLGVGHCIHTGPLGTDSELTELLLAWGAVREACSPRLMLPGGKLVNFYQLMPLYANEVRYRNERGFTRLWQRLMSREIGPVVDMDRECCYDPDADLALELSPFLWTQGKECGLSLYTGEFLQEQFEAVGLEGSGYDWEALAKAHLEKRFPTLVSYIHFDSEEDLFYAYATAEDALRIFALSLRDLCGDQEAFGELLSRIFGNKA